MRPRLSSPELNVVLAQLEVAKRKSARARSTWTRRNEEVARLEEAARSIRQALSESTHANARGERLTREVARRKAQFESLARRLSGRALQGKRGLDCLEPGVRADLVRECQIDDTSALKRFLDSEEWVLSSKSNSGALRWKVSGIVDKRNELQLSILCYALRAMGWPKDDEPSDPQRFADSIRRTALEPDIRRYLEGIGWFNSVVADDEQYRIEATLRLNWEIETGGVAAPPRFAWFPAHQFGGRARSWVDTPQYIREAREASKISRERYYHQVIPRGGIKRL